MVTHVHSVSLTDTAADFVTGVSRTSRYFVVVRVAAEVKLQRGIREDS